jgi:hypothetical protein
VRTLQRLLMSDFRINRPATTVKSTEIGVLCQIARERTDRTQNNLLASGWVRS